MLTIAVNFNEFLFAALCLTIEAQLCAHFVTGFLSFLLTAECDVPIPLIPAVSTVFNDFRLTNCFLTNAWNVTVLERRHCFAGDLNAATEKIVMKICSF